MSRIQYAGIPEQFAAPTVNILSGGSVTSAKAGTYYFWLQGRNRYGYNLASATPTSATIATGQRAQVILPASLRPNNPEAIDLVEILVLIGTSSSLASAAVAGTYPGYEADGVTLRSLPASITLSEDEHFAIGVTVATAASLPSNPIHGMRRNVDQDGQIVAYDVFLDQWNAVVPQSFNPLVGSTTEGLGCNTDLATIISEGNETNVLPVAYSFDGESIPLKFWLVNDSDYSIASGTPITCSFAIPIKATYQDVSLLIAQATGADIYFHGYADAETGDRDSTGAGGAGTMAGIDTGYQYPGTETGLRLPKELEPGNAYVLGVRLNMQVHQLGGRGAKYSLLRVQPQFASRRAIYQPGAEIFGSYVLNYGGLRRIVPNGSTPLSALALSGRGSVVVQSGQSYGFRSEDSQEVFLLASNTADQEAYISAPGDVFISSSQPALAAIRAVIGTVDGVGRNTGFIDAIALDSTKQLRLTITLPTQIRADYPDVVAGSTDGAFNGTNLVVYVKSQSGGNVLRFTDTWVLGEASQTFTFGASAGTNTGSTSLPADPDDDFGLYELTESSITSVAAISQPSTFSNATYDIAYAIEYSSTLTSVSHSPDLGCIYEAAGDMADLFNSFKYWGSAALNIATLKNIAAEDLQHGQVRWVLTDADGFRSLYLYDASASDADDDDLVVQPTAVTGNGRFFKIFTYDGQPPYFAEPIANFTALRALPVSHLRDGQLRLIFSDNNGDAAIFWYNANEAGADNGTSIIKPTAVSGNGAFNRMSGGGSSMTVESIAPAGAPARIGESYFWDAGVLYVATGTSSVGDWKMAGFDVDLILTDSSGDVLVDSSGNVLLNI